MKRWIVLAVAIFTTACLGTATPAPEVPRVEITSPEYIPECQPAPGVTLRLQKMSDTFVEIIASGLQPGETPYVHYQMLDGEVLGKGGAYPGNPVNEEGEFFFELQNLEPREGQTSAAWDIRLVHEGGVECETITLP